MEVKLEISQLLYLRYLIFTGMEVGLAKSQVRTRWNILHPYREFNSSYFYVLV
jgi:hypothetical protein